MTTTASVYLVRVADDDSFYRINWATEGPGTGTTRPPLGMSIQKYHNGTWTQVFTETTPKFLPGDSVPFDVIVSAVGNTIQRRRAQRSGWRSSTRFIRPGRR